MTLKRFFNKPVVVDTSILFDFFELDALYILNAVFSDVYIPAELMAEIVNDKQLVIVKRKVDFKEIVMETVEAYNLFLLLAQRKRRLSIYDRHLLCTAYEKGYFCASNDGLISKVCRELKVDNPRTLGILGCANLYQIISKPELENFLSLLVSDQCSSYLTVNDKTLLEFATMFGITLEWRVNR